MSSATSLQQRHRRTLETMKDLNTLQSYLNLRPSSNKSFNDNNNKIKYEKLVPRFKVNPFSQEFMKNVDNKKNNDNEKNQNILKYRDAMNKKLEKKLKNKLKNDKDIIQFESKFRSTTTTTTRKNENEMDFFKDYPINNRLNIGHHENVLNTLNATKNIKRTNDFYHINKRWNHWNVGDNKKKDNLLNTKNNKNNVNKDRTDKKLKYDIDKKIENKLKNDKDIIQFESEQNEIDWDFKDHPINNRLNVGHHQNVLNTLNTTKNIKRTFKFYNYPINKRWNHCNVGDKNNNIKHNECGEYKNNHIGEDNDIWSNHQYLKRYTLKPQTVKTNNGDLKILHSLKYLINDKETDDIVLKKIDLIIKTYIH